MLNVLTISKIFLYVYKTTLRAFRQCVYSLPAIIVATTMHRFFNWNEFGVHAICIWDRKDRADALVWLNLAYIYIYNT